MEDQRIESKLEVETYLLKLKYALNNGAKISFQEKRNSDKKRDNRHTNKYTVAALFPEEDPLVALRRELLSLCVEEYMYTAKDRDIPNRSEMRAFGKTYNCNEDVYIKIRVELIDSSNAGNHTTFVMSFHFADYPFRKEDFPYRDK